MMHADRAKLLEEQDGMSLDELRSYRPTSGAAAAAPDEGFLTAAKQAVLSELERKRRARTIVVPTDDSKVCARLRKIGEPITLFGEGPADRRDRLRELLSKQQDHLDDLDMDEAEEEAEFFDDEEKEEEYATEGSPELLQMRRALARYSLARARKRIARQLVESKMPLAPVARHRRALNERLKLFHSLGSQIGGERAVGICRIALDSSVVAAGSWNSSIELLSLPSLDKVQSLMGGHTGIIGGLAWYPVQGEEPLSLASGGAEGNVCLWSATQQTPLHILKGHDRRVCRVEFHPSGRALASASFDQTFRLWDVDSQKCVLCQDGHAAEVYSIGFSQDGSLLASGGREGIGRVWDLRTGRTIMSLDEHRCEILGIDWAVDGYRCLTASADASVKVWDLRKVQCIHTISAHKQLVSDIRFFRSSFDEAPVNSRGEVVPRSSGTYLATSGFDGCVNVTFLLALWPLLTFQLWSTDDWMLQKTLTGHTGKVMSTDIARNGRYVVSSGWDRTVRVYSTDEDGVEKEQENNVH